MKKRFSGFTLVELLIVTPIVLFVIGTVVVAVVTITGDAMAQTRRNAMSYDIDKAFNQIKTDLKITNRFLSINSITPTSPSGSANDATSFKNAGSSLGNVLIMNISVTNGNPNDDGTSFVYAINSPYACSTSATDQNTHLYADVVYFISNGSLWRRVITQSNYTTAGCTTPWQQPSCAPGISGTICKTTDEELVDDISSFSIDYYNRYSQVSSLTDAVSTSLNDTQRQAALLLANTIQVSITTEKNISGREVIVSNSIKLSIP